MWQRSLAHISLINHVYCLVFTLLIFFLSFSLYSACVRAFEQTHHGCCFPRLTKPTACLRYGLVSEHFLTRELPEIKPSDQETSLQRFLTPRTEATLCIDDAGYVNLFVLLHRHKIRVSRKIRGEHWGGMGGCRGTTPQGSRDYGVIKRSESRGWTHGWTHVTHNIYVYVAVTGRGILRMKRGFSVKHAQ